MKSCEMNHVKGTAHCLVQGKHLRKAADCVVWLSLFIKTWLLQGQGGGERDVREVDFHTEGSLQKPTTEKGKGISYLKSPNTRQKFIYEKISVRWTVEKDMQPEVENVPPPAGHPEPRSGLSG